MKHAIRRLALASLVSLAAAARTFAGDVPDAVAGRWVAGTASGTTYWSDNGTFLGGGRGTGQFYEFKPDGTFRYCMVMEVRTGYVVSRVRTECRGTVQFAAHRFTLHTTGGHYHSEISGKVSDRDMTDSDCKKMSKAYDYRTGTGPDGRPRFVVPFEDGSKFDFEPAEAPPTEK